MTKPKLTIRQALSYGRSKLCGIENSEAEAKWLLQNATKLSSTQFILQLNTDISQDALELYTEMLQRRILGEPVQYILEEWDFYGLKFAVGNGVLIPRPETELLVDIALKHINNTDIKNPNILDICAGSGCIGIAILNTLQNCKCTAVEISEKAIQYLKQNCKKYNISINILKTDILTFKPNHFSEKFDLITSNPPYVCSAEIDTLEKELHFEPRIALDGGSNGLIFYEKIIPLAAELLKNNGAIVLEIGEKQADSVKMLLKNNGFSEILIHKDFNNLDRILYAKYKYL